MSDGGKRRKNDHYVTPDWAICRLLERYLPPRSDRILDPCGARGELITVAKQFFPLSQFAACEINPDFEADLRAVVNNAVVMGDFLAEPTLEILSRCEFDFVLTNPPYALAQSFVTAALEVAPVVAMLLRINFLASQHRRNWLHSLKPGVFVLPNRPSFTGDGGDMTEYAWFVFGDPDVAGQLDFLELTPAEAIKAANKRAKDIHGRQVAFEFA